MAIVKVVLLYKCSKILIAKLLPCIGSVPEPSSSTKTKLFEVELFNISIMFNICEENVLKDS